MSSRWRKEPQDVADSILKRAEHTKVIRRLQNCLALAQFKTKHGLEELTLDSIEPRFEEEIKRKRLHDGEPLSDSSSSVSDVHYPTRALMSSPLKPAIFSDALGSSHGTSGHRKRKYLANFNQIASSPRRRFRQSPTAHRSFGFPAWQGNNQLTHSSPIKPRRQQHFTNPAGPDVSFFQQPKTIGAPLTSPSFAVPSDDEDDLAALRRFNASNVRSSPPRTPPTQTRGLAVQRSREGWDAAEGGKTPQEGADLLLYLASSPSPAVKSNRARMGRLTTPPPKDSKLDLPSSMMTTPGGGKLFPNTPGQGFDFSEFVNVTPSPAQKPWRTPGPTPARTPKTATRARLTFDNTGC